MEHGSRKAARAFQKEFPDLNESTMRTFMKKYVEQRGLKKRLNASSSVSLPSKRRGRPVLLGPIDRKVRDFLIALRDRGGLVSSTIAIAVAKAFISGSCDQALKNLQVGNPWAQSLFRRMGFVGRMATTAKVPIPDKSQYLIRLEKKWNTCLCRKSSKRSKSITSLTLGYKR